MWDNPRQLNLAAGALTGIAALIFGVAGLQQLLRSALFPVREVVVLGALKNVERADLEHAAKAIGGNFFALDLRAARARFEQLPWVRRVDLRRLWPDRLEVSVEEHVALARWGMVEDDLRSSALVNTFGERFSGRNAAPLPLLAGPAGSEALVAERYRRFVELLAPISESVERVVLTPRHAWQLQLASGLTVELGRDGNEPVDQRLARFVAVFPETLGRLARRDAAQFPHVDLRYPNGFALRVTGWKG